MADETAVLDPEDTGEAAEEQEAVAPAENTEAGADAETEGAEATENEEAEEPPVTRADLERELKAQKARLEESFRQKEENARREAEEKATREAYTQRLTTGQQAINGQAFREFAAMYKAATDQGLEQIPQQWLGTAAAKLGDAAFVTQHSLYQQFISQQFDREFDGFRIPNDIRARMDSATQSMNFGDQVKSWFEAMVAAVREKETPKLKDELKKQADEARKTAQQRKQDDGPRPTGNLSAGAPGKVLTLKEIDEMPVSKWNTYSDKERKDMLDRAYELAAKGRN